MANLNTLNCLINTANTGIEACSFDPQNIVGAFLAPKNYLLTQTQLASLQASLLSGVQNANKSARLFPIFGFTALSDSSEDGVIQSMAYGPKYYVRDGYLDWKFEFVPGGLTLLSRLRQFDPYSHDFFFVDSANNIIGTAGVDGTGAAALKAIPVSGGFFKAHPWKANDGSKITNYMLQFVFAPKFINELVAYVQAGFDVPSTINGLVDVVLTSPGANSTSGSYNVNAATAGVGTNMAQLYGSTLANATLWVAKNAQTGNPIAISTVALNTAGNGFVFALNKSDANYPTGTSDQVSFQLAAPSALITGGIGGYESNVLGIVKN